MRIIPTIIGLMLCLLASASSQESLSALRKQAETSQAQITAPGSPCNQGEGEKFAEFIVKFTVDAGFNAKRSKISTVFALKPISNYKALVVTSGHDAGYYQQWRQVSESEVQLICGFEGAPADYLYIFKRQADGQWHLVDRTVPDF